MRAQWCWETSKRTGSVRLRSRACAGYEYVCSMQLHGALLCYLTAVHLLVGRGAAQAIALLSNSKTRASTVACSILMCALSVLLVHTGMLLSRDELVLIWCHPVGTVAHPYLLADNRHYTFYIWKVFPVLQASL
jgi:hypothetical protein